ncbi:MAG: rubrerythrin [Bacteroidota bacterium]
MKGTRTEKNLLAAFAGESQARNRYDFFGSAAEKEGFVHIANLFRETALQEKEHAKRFFKFLPGGETDVMAAFPAGKIGKTSENLLAAARGEHHEWSELYPSFARIAREEGFEEVARAFEAISVAEKQHERRYRGLLENVENGKVFQKEQSVTWRCLNCGFLHEGPEAPQACAACNHPRAFFEVLAENW